MIALTATQAVVAGAVLCLWLAGEYMSVNGTAMMVSILQVVLIPVLAGLLVFGGPG